MSEEPGIGVVVPPPGPPSTMSFDDGQQWMIWKDRAECALLTQPQIIEAMVEEAETEGYEPCDFNYAGVPNVYLRAAYTCDENGAQQKYMGDGFAMFVKKTR